MRDAGIHTMQKAASRKAKNKGAKNAQSAQDRFLSQLAAERTKVTVFLVNGIRLEGRIASFDEHVILLEGEMTDHVYKHAVSTIQPAADAVANNKHSVRQGPARAATGVRARVGPDDEHAAAEATPRQPVVVIRTKRRSIKNTDDQG